MEPEEARRGSEYPKPVNVCPTLRRASSTVRDRTGLPLGAMEPVRYRWAKTWRRAIGSWRLVSRASMANSSQKSDQRRQWVLELAAR